MNGITGSPALGTVGGSSSARAAVVRAAAEWGRRVGGMHLVRATDIANHSPIISQDGVARLGRTVQDSLGQAAEAVGGALANCRSSKSGVHSRHGSGHGRPS